MSNSETKLKLLKSKRQQLVAQCVIDRMTLEEA